MKYAKVLLFIVLNFFMVTVFGQSASGKSIENQNNPTLITETSENGTQSFTFDLSNTAETVTRSSTSSSVWMFVRMIIVLALVIAAIYAVMRFFRKDSGFAKPKTDDEFLRRVASLAIGPGKSIEVISLIDHAYLIGVTDENINLIGEVTDKELIDAMNLYADKNQNVTKSRTFADVLEMFMPGGANRNSEKNTRTDQRQNIFDNPANNLSDAIKRQRERLNDMETE